MTTSNTANAQIQATPEKTTNNAHTQRTKVAQATDNLTKAQNLYDVAAVHGKQAQQVLDSMFGAENDIQKLEARRAALITKLGGLKVRAVGAVLYALGLSYLPRTELFKEVCAEGTHPLSLLKSFDDVLSNREKPRGKMAQLEKKELKTAYNRLFKSALGHKTRFCHASRTFKTEMKIQGVARALDRLLAEKGLTFSKYDPSSQLVHLAARKMKEFDGAQVELPEHHAEMTLNEVMEACEAQVQEWESKKPHAQAGADNTTREGDSAENGGEGAEGGEGSTDGASAGQETHPAVAVINAINALNTRDFTTLKLLLATAQEGNACDLYNAAFQQAQDTQEAREEKVINPEFELVAEAVEVGEDDSQGAH